MCRWLFILILVFRSAFLHTGWCKNFDKVTHMCTTYEKRPGFCRIEKLQGLYGVEDADMGDFATESCREHIGECAPLQAAHFPCMDASPTVTTLGWYASSSH